MNVNMKTALMGAGLLSTMGYLIYHPTEAEKLKNGLKQAADITDIALGMITILPLTFLTGKSECYFVCETAEQPWGAGHLRLLKFSELIGIQTPKS